MHLSFYLTPQHLSETLKAYFEQHYKTAQMLMAGKDCGGENEIGGKEKQ